MQSISQSHKISSLHFHNIREVVNYPNQSSSIRFDSIQFDWIESNYSTIRFAFGLWWVVAYCEFDAIYRNRRSAKESSSLYTNTQRKSSFIYLAYSSLIYMEVVSVFVFVSWKIHVFLCEEWYLCVTSSLHALSNRIINSVSGSCGSRLCWAYWYPYKVGFFSFPYPSEGAHRRVLMLENITSTHVIWVLISSTRSTIWVFEYSPCNI